MGQKSAGMFVGFVGGYGVTMFAGLTKAVPSNSMPVSRSNTFYIVDRCRIFSLTSPSSLSTTRAEACCCHDDAHVR
eukprot:350265-Chlamydomonas_euryale.AAC.3